MSRESETKMMCTSRLLFNYQGIDHIEHLYAPKIVSYLTKKKKCINTGICRPCLLLCTKDISMIYNDNPNLKCS